MANCKFVVDENDPLLVRCAECGKEVRLQRAGQRMHAVCKPKSPEPSSAAPWPDYERRRQICMECNSMVRGGDEPAGCKHHKKCARVAIWENSLRTGRCPEKKWGYSQLYDSFTGGQQSGSSSFYVIGNPGPVGGACTELWHTIRVWVQAGLTPCVVPTFGTSNEWKEKILGAGALVRIPNESLLSRSADKKLHFTRESLEDSGIAGSTVVSFCNANFLEAAPILLELGCRLIWVNCMNWLFDKEVEFVEKHGAQFTWVCQSEYQRRQLYEEGHPTRNLKCLGVQPESMRVIRGAFYPDEFPYGPRPHAPSTDFTFGRLARADRDKWSSNTWSIYNSVPYDKKRVRVMGWRKEIEEKLGKPPVYAETMEPGKESAQSFVSSLHAMVPINGGARENWPRVGLEAMAAGVPLVVQNQWGWREMLVHGDSGLLCNSDSDFAYNVAKLAREEGYRLRIAEGGRARLAQLCDPVALGEQWKELICG